MFTSRSNHYTRNIADGETLTVKPAFLTAPTGREQGVAVLDGSNPRLVLREDHALALCNAIIDALDLHRKAP